ncbi:DUF6266 family protein [Pedobacter faecalis]|uniref:DUF6266 family protein n=1 Tax=Pedobacter faecalis TaxID=3041495 RepID=UPI00254C4015|nr:DUF6266 family protein [Pedobacter sp. ELA7]
MGKYLKGILGSFSGLIGTVVGASWKGIDYMRSRPKKSNKPATEEQQKQRDTFALVTSFLRPITDVVNLGFQAYNKGETPYNAAFSSIMDKAITGVYPAVEINYPQVELSRGSLLDCPEISVASDEESTLSLTWVDNAPTPDKNSNATDKISIVVYNPVKNKYVTAISVVARSTGSYEMSLPLNFSGDEVAVWAFFAAANGKKVNDSVFLGEIPVM